MSFNKSSPPLSTDFVTKHLPSYFPPVNTTQNLSLCAVRQGTSFLAFCIVPSLAIIINVVVLVAVLRQRKRLMQESHVYVHVASTVVSNVLMSILGLIEVSVANLLLKYVVLVCFQTGTILSECDSKSLSIRRALLNRQYAKHKYRKLAKITGGGEGGKWGKLSRTSNHWGEPKNPNNVASTFFRLQICSQKTLGSNMGAPNLFHAPDAI